MLPMPRQVGRVRPVRRVGRDGGAPGGVHQLPDAFDVIHLTGDEHVEIVGKTDQAAIEHPVCRSGERNAVADLVWPAALDGLDVSCLNLGATTAGFFNGPTGALTLGNSLTLNFSTSLISDGQTYNLFDFGSQTGDFSAIGLTGSIVGSLLLTATDTWTGNAAGYAFTFNETNGILSVNAVPEPSTYAALAGAVALVGAAVYRRRKA